MIDLNDLGIAVRAEMRKLQRPVHMPILVEQAPSEIGPTSVKLPRFPHGLIERMLRIELSEEISWQMRRDSRNGAFPTTFMGVTVYCCGPEYNLPECGWRVVNPFDKPVGG